MNRRKIKILFVRPKPFWKKRLQNFLRKVLSKTLRGKNVSQSSFIQKDLELLRKYFDVRVVEGIILNKREPISTLKSVFKMIRGFLWADTTFSWFADVHALSKEE